MVFIEGLQRLIRSGVAGLIITPPKDIWTAAEFEQLQSLLDGQVPVVYAIREIEGIEGEFLLHGSVQRHTQGL